MTDPNMLLHPKPRRNFDLNAVSDNSSPPSPPSRQPSDSSRNEPDSISEKASRTRSILNLTSSTLFGIYTPASGYENTKSEPSTPLGTGSQTPARPSVDNDRPSMMGVHGRPPSQRTEKHPYRFGFWKNFVPLSERVVLLFIFGVAYGVIISHLHDTQQVAPIQVDLRGIEHNSWGYLLGWGGVGVLIGALLPWIDMLWEEVLGSDKDVFAFDSQRERPVSPVTGDNGDERSASRSRNGLGADWNPVVRGIGAFVGIAFAIRKLPWQSISQVSLTLALVNPVLWYLVDRSKPGFLLSMFVGLAGTAIAFGVNPEIVPSPATPSPRAGLPLNASREYGMYDGLVSNESIGVGTWIASVLFCSSVCFGNIGRRLALGMGGRRSGVLRE